MNAKTPRNAAAPPARSPTRQPAFDVALHVPAGPPHVDDERGDEHGRRKRQNAFPERLIARALQQNAEPDADGRRHGDAPVNGGDEAAAGFSEVRQADGDDQKRFEPFTEGDDERLQHRWVPRPSAENENDLSLTIESIATYPTSQVGYHRMARRSLCELRRMNAALP